MQIFFIAFLTIFLTNLSLCFASTDVILNVEGCNNNNICEEPAENDLICPNDCNPCNSNSVCEVLKGETSLSCPSDCRVASHRGGGGTIISTTTISAIATGTVSNINVIVGINYAHISWNTSVPSYGSLSFGTGDVYDGGTISDTNISNRHDILIENLSASTTYSYLINSTLSGYYYADSFGKFTTLSIPAIKTVPSIWNLIANPSGKEIILSWQNPASKDFAGVKIVRSPFFYPTDPQEGKVIYNGSGNYSRDSDVVFDTKYFYSAFSYDQDLNYSSAAVVASQIKSPYSSTTEAVEEGKEIGKIVAMPLNNYIFIQGDLELPVSSSSVTVYPFNDLKIIIDASRFAGPVKNLIIKIQDPAVPTQSYSYSFSFDSARKFYYIVIPNLGNTMVYPFKITSFDLNNKTTSLAEGNLDVKAIKEMQSNYWFNYLLIALVFAIMIAIFHILKRKMLKKTNKL